MTSFLRSLFGSKARPADESPTAGTPVAAGVQPADQKPGADTTPVAAGVRPDERIEDLHDEFCRTFCHRPGVNFMDYLAAEGATRMIAWLRPSTPCALPKGFIRLAVDSTRKGSKFWEQAEIKMFYECNWTEGGGLPPQESQDAVSVLAQMFAMPITIYYTEIQDGPIMKMVFEP